VVHKAHQPDALVDFFDADGGSLLLVPKYYGNRLPLSTAIDSVTWNENRAGGHGILETWFAEVRANGVEVVSIRCLKSFVHLLDDHPWW
jgi:hypothetical protein